VDGPWGSFLVVDVGIEPGLHALLIAPWAGREEPRPADLTLLDLLGQHAATALEHATLYSRVRAQAEELDRLSHIEADFLRGVTHDLQTPLTSISALAGELRGAERLSHAARTDLEAIEYQADRLRRMVGQLLTVSALEAGGVQPRGEVFRVEPIVRRVWRTLQVEGRDLVLEVRGADRLAVGDPARVEQVCWALLDNAVKYSPADSTVRVVLDAHRPREIDPRPSSGLVEEIVIRDEGMGLSDEARARAFERFYRSPEARQRVPDGSGIGLFTARRLIELMGGTVSIDADGGRGTTVRIVLPAEPAVRESPEAA
jgi:signal transduction histidine kinase